MSPQGECSLATPQEVAAACSLFRRSFGVRADPALWRRKYFENPAGPAVCFVVKDRGEVVSFASLHPLVFRLREERALLYQYGDAMTDPAYRGRGLYTALKEASADWLRAAGVPLTLSFPNAGTNTIARRLGYSVLGYMTRWLKPVFFGRHKTPPGVAEVAGDDERLIAAAARALHAPGPAAVRSAEYYLWRYGPGARAWVSGGGGAYAVAVVTSRGLWVQDLGMAVGESGALRRVVQAMVAFAASRRARHISYPRLGPAYRAELFANGFVPFARGAVVLAQAITPAGRSWLGERNWHLTDADRDLDTRI